MKRFVSFLSIAVLTFWGITAYAQTPTYILDSSIFNTNITIGSDNGYISDDNANTANHPSAYALDKDYWVTFCGECTTPYKFAIDFFNFDIHPDDTLYIYDGNSINAPLLIAANNNFNSLLHRQVFASAANMSGCLTLRFVTHSSPGRVADSNAGFYALLTCKLPCETSIPHIDTMYFKMRNGVITDTCYIKPFTVYDTSIFVDDNGDSTINIIPELFRGVNLCLGEDVMLRARGEYSNDFGFYYPIDATTMFRWNLGNGQLDSTVGGTTVVGHYRDLDCYDVTLQLMDEQGCYSSMIDGVRVRLAQNPIKTLFTLNPICSTDSLLVNVGYDGENGTVTLRRITFEKTRSKVTECKTFLPDGPKCETQCFYAPIAFDEFPSGRTVNSAADICSVCINMEHEFTGDVDIAIICPTQKKSRFKTRFQVDGFGAGTYGGGGYFLGIPYGYDAHHTYDDACDNVDQSTDFYDSICNVYGVGMDYCFSCNKDYTLVNGMSAKNNTTDHTQYLGNTNAPIYLLDAFSHTFSTIPAPFYQAGTTAPQENAADNTRTPSNHDEKTDYYNPMEDFDALVGCPLNGIWQIEVCDTYGQDNGWIFNWSLDICGISSGVGCEYQVGLDSVTWIADSSYGDWQTGHFRGLHISKRDAITSWISTPDTAGTFPIFVTLYDEFGCVWDSLTSITSVWTPMPELGPDITLCDVETTVIDAKDRHAEYWNYGLDTARYMWEPFGTESDTVHTRGSMGSSTLYTVEVQYQKINYATCSARDSVRINVNHQPLPNFDPGIYPLEGCEPFTIHFENTSKYGDKFYWVFGDGDTSTTKSPTHTYGTGQYDFKYYVSSEHGCQDSLVYQDLITVYSSPVARFSWEPMNPTVLHPEVTFQNMTIPQSDDNKYYWEIQYDRDNPISYHTLRDVNPSFEWYTNGEDISGNYIARLIAKTENLGPSGNIVECRDTIENTILLVNDFLQFPTALTPNGDGVNDKFIIKNLIDGLGYPNNSLAIYDRWGKRVYYKENISSEDDFWDPGADNVPAGTYFWRFVGKGYLGDIQRNGAVEVLR